MSDHEIGRIRNKNISQDHMISSFLQQFLLNKYEGKCLLDESSTLGVSRKAISTVSHDTLSYTAQKL